MVRGYHLHEPAGRWEESSIVGNGTIGAMIEGGATHDVVTLAHEKLFAPIHPERLLPPDMGKHLPEIRQLILEGRYDEATQLPLRMMERMYQLPSAPWTNPLFPACDILIDTEDAEGIKGYCRSADFYTGVCEVRFSASDVEFTRELFVSRAGGVGVLRLRASRPANYQLSIRKRPWAERETDWVKIYRDNRLDSPELVAVDGVLCYRMRYTDLTYGYECALYPARTDGSVTVLNGQIAITGSTECLLLFSLVPMKNDFNGREIERMKALPGDYEALLQRHTALHQSLMERIHLSLGNKDLEAKFNAGRYEILSSTGEYPPVLQGLWTKIYGVPWSSDYTNNGNTQTSTLSMLPTGMTECMLSVFNYLEERMDDFRLNAMRIYNCRGIHFGSRTSNNGLDFHFREPWCMLFWTAGAGWMAHFYYDYWLFTGDDAFFKVRALPFMKEAALFYEDFLTEGEDGKWVFNPSYSPENNPANTHSHACINATMDIAVARELFRNLITGCATLGIEYEGILRWRRMLEKMPDYQINEDGAVREWLWSAHPDRYDHRHASHLYPLYYGLPVEIAGDSALMAGFQRAYELRMEHKEVAKGTMAFGYIQCAMAAAHLGDAPMVDLILSTLANEHYYPTLATSHDAGPSIFNADLSGGLPALMLEAIAQCQPVTDSKDRIRSYQIKLLPALPSCMMDGSVTGLHLRGGFRLDMRWAKGHVTFIRVENTRNNDYHLVRGAHDLGLKNKPGI